MKKMKKIPSYEECLELCSKNTSFYESINFIDGFKISVFNYRLATYNDFLSTDFSKELRGLTYVFNLDGTIYNKYLLLEKFFNLNQVPDTMYSEVKDFKIKSIYNKEDGSIASFIKLPNGKIIGKSKMGFDNDQSIQINKIYKTNKSVKRFVDKVLSLNYIPIFEYVAPSNKIVLRYVKEDLILLRLRDNVTGELLDLNDYLDVIGDVRVTPSEAGYTLDDLIEMASYTEDKEGWIIEFTNGVLMKIKTDFYFKLHGLYTEDLNRENIIIDYILKDEIDDVLSKITDDLDTIERINKITDKVKSSINKKSNEIDKLYNVFLSINDRKEFALLYNKEENFGYVMSMLSGKNSFELAKDYIGKKTNKLLSAREWLSI